MEVSPCRGIRYNQKMVRDLARVVCPPYDVITPEQQELYYKESDYNVIRLEFPEPTADRYQGAAIFFQQWLKKGILQYDSVSSFYMHDHHFEHSGEKMVRRGLIARVKLEHWGNGIFPHEETSSKAKSDRLQLMRACRAQFSPLFSLYHDSEQKVAPVLSRIAEERPLMSLRAKRSNLPHAKEAHTLWAISDPEIKQELMQVLSCQPLYVADGHHRYETALTYQQERMQVSRKQIPSLLRGEGHGESQEAKQSLTGREAFNYVMMELVDFSDPGLVVLPIHRLVGGIVPSVLAGLGDQLRNFFALEYVPIEAGRSRLPSDSCLGILGLRSGSLVVLKKRQDISLDVMMPRNRSEAYRKFGVSILNHIILDNVLNGAKDLDVSYTVDFEEAYQQVTDGKYQLAFLLNPPQPEMVRAVANARDRMPRKSTYFYPKLPAGLVINPLD
jgi:uncharacterized protein (DUF1015 family)